MELIEIGLEEIKENPANPRADLGDLTELAESIKKNGVMQNLTVVDDGDGYMAVIGHRRLAAAKLAGLKTVPCQVEELTPKEQMSLMLAENIQRNSLTPYEQAQGFQMFLDLGADIPEIMEKTGFSESTVRHRLKLAELDQDLLKEKSGEQIMMKDLIKLEQIKDPDRKNGALKEIGTNNFDWAVRNAIGVEENEEKIAKIEDWLISFAEKVKEMPEGTRIIKTIYLYDENMETPKDAPERPYFYKMTGAHYPAAYLYAEEDETDHEADERMAEIQRKNERQNAANKEIDDICKRMRGQRREYVFGLRESECRTRADILIAQALACGLAGADILSEENVQIAAEIDEIECYANLNESIEILSKKDLYKTLVRTIYLDMDLGEWAMMLRSFDGTYAQNAEIEALYDFLKKIGYKTSDEELEMINGTHRAYLKDQEDGEE